MPQDLRELISRGPRWFHTENGAHARLDEALDRAELFVRTDMPSLNTRVENRSATTSDFLRAAGPLVAAITREFSPAIVSRIGALRTLQISGFIVSSAERHLQALGSPPGATLADLGVESMLGDAGRIGLHPPRDAAPTYWLLNAYQPMTFTGHQGEELFNDIVNQTYRQQSAVADLLRPLCSGHISVDGAEAVERLDAASEHTQRLVLAFRSFMARMEDGSWALTPEFFMLRLRTYLCAYPIGGADWAGVNAAHVWPQISVDYLLGTVTDEYWPYVLANFEYFPPEGWGQIVADRNTPSLFTRLLRHVHLHVDDVDSLSETQICRLLDRQSPQYRGDTQLGIGRTPSL